VPRVGLGLAALGRPGYINLGHTSDLAAGKGVEEMRVHSWEVMDAAYAAGVRGRHASVRRHAMTRMLTHALHRQRSAPPTPPAACFTGGKDAPDLHLRARRIAYPRVVDDDVTSGAVAPHCMVGGVRMSGASGETLYYSPTT
jgi:hypothetical protein